MRKDIAIGGRPALAGGGVLLVAAALVAPMPAQAAPEVPSGRYTVLYTDSDKSTNWMFAPCGSDCTLATSQDGGTFVISWEFDLANGRWTHSGATQAPCANGAYVPATVDYSFDAVSLAGEGRTTTSDGCGGPGSTVTRPFRLIKS